MEHIVESVTGKSTVQAVADRIEHQQVESPNPNDVKKKDETTGRSTSSSKEF